MMKRWVLSGPFDQAGFLEQEAVAGARLLQLLDQNALGALVGDGDEIGRPLHRDLQIFDFAEIADQPPAGLAGGGGHDVQGRGEIGHIKLDLFGAAHIGAVFGGDDDSVRPLR